MILSIKKIKKFFVYKKVFGFASTILNNGYYQVRGDIFEIQPKGGVGFLRVHSKDKIMNQLNKGTFRITKFKYIFMNEQNVYTFIPNKERYQKILQRISIYKSNLPYKTMTTEFVESKQLIVSDVIKGEKYNDEEHLWMFVSQYLNAIQLNHLKKRSITFLDQKYLFLYYPQHGDCQSRNIIWKENCPFLIDLDDVNHYPLFYDVFYYIIMSKREGAFDFFKQEKFAECVESFCKKSQLNKIPNFIDYYLFAYVLDRLKNTTKDTAYKMAGWHLQYFVKANLSSFPLLQTAINEYKKIINYKE